MDALPRSGSGLRWFWRSSSRVRCLEILEESFPCRVEVTLLIEPLPKAFSEWRTIHSESRVADRKGCRSDTNLKF